MATPTLPALLAKADALYGEADPRYRLVVLRRFKRDGRQQVPGDLLLEPSLRRAATFVRLGAARPVDAATTRDVELFLLLEKPTQCAID